MTAAICSRDKWNQSIISPIEAPTSRLSKTTETGVRVSRKIHSPLRLPRMLSTAGHGDQSRAMFLPWLIVACYGVVLPRLGAGSRTGMAAS
jgi:hypothetical protein